MQRFLLISVCLHAVAALLLLRVDAIRDDILRPGQHIELTLRAFNEPVQQAAATPALPQDVSPARAATKPVTAQQKPSTLEPRPANTDRDTPPATVADTQAVSSQRHDVDTVNTLRSELASALQARFRYPRRAQKRGWEGTVVISLRILPDGQLTDIQIANSSGVPVLDRAAVRSLSEVSISRHVAWLAGREIDMLIPVEYRLTDS
jgi:protein TonB